MGVLCLAVRCSAWIRSSPHFSQRSISGGLKMGRKNAKNKINQKESGKERPWQVASQATKKVPHSLNIVAVGTGGPGTPRCVLLTTEFTRYMFNCGGGTQRLISMDKSLRATAFAKISGLENIFITHKSWENTGGLLGVAMLLEGQKNPESKGHSFRQAQMEQGSNRNQRIDIPGVKVYGPEGVENVIMMARKFSENMNMKIERSDRDFEDAAVKISSVKFHRNPSASGENQSEDSSGPPSKKAKLEPSPLDTTPNSEVYAYICKAKPPLPKINVEKCLEAGITLGPMVGQLQRGDSVVLQDGTVVYPEQVTDKPNSKNLPFLILECPSEEFLPGLVACSPLNEFRSQDVSEPFGVIVHMTPSKVFNCEGYQAWMCGFGADVDHLVINEDSCCADLTRVNDHQARLNLIDRNVFPILPGLLLDAQVELVASESEKTRHACSGMIYAIRGKQLGFQIEHDDFNLKKIQEGVLWEPDMRAEVEKLKKIESVPEALDSDAEESNGNSYPKVVFLGTGSSEPNRLRAQSCIVVQVSKHSVIMLDCGEDAFNQLYRFYGPEKCSRVLRKLKAVFISHLHSDHHLGLFNILKERKKAFEEKGIPFTPAFLLAPVQIRRWLKFYQNELEPVIHLFRFWNHQQLKNQNDGLQTADASQEDFLKDLGLVQYEAVQVIHCHNAFGCAFTHGNGFKLVYSGDTRPCDALCDAGQDCDLLIHEATHEDDLLTNAKISRHSTTSEALEVGRRMKAKHIILTHFSQRYSHMVPLSGVDLPANMGLAFDNMQVSPKGLPVLPKLIPALMCLFYNKLTKLEYRTLKRNR